MFPGEVSSSHYMTAALEPQQCFTQLANANEQLLDSCCLCHFVVLIVTFIKCMLSSIYELILGQVY